VANLGSTTTTAAPAAQPTGQRPNLVKLVEFARCIRSNGVRNFPIPDASGVFKKTAQQLGVTDSQYQAAQGACNHLLPEGGEAPTITPADEADYQRGVACICSHGVANFPDPTISKNQVKFNISRSLDQSSARFKLAVETCEKLIPAGLPFSGNTGGA